MQTYSGTRVPNGDDEVEDGTTCGRSCIQVPGVIRISKQHFSDMDPAYEEGVSLAPHLAK